MTEPAYYKLTEVETLLRCSRDTINRLERVGLLKVDGATSRLLARIEKGESMGSASRRHSRAKRTRTYGEGSVYYDRDRRQWCNEPPTIDKKRQPW